MAIGFLNLLLAIKNQLNILETTIITLKNTTNVGNDTLHMTSLEIAELTGKQHKDVLKAIRNMEPAWEKTTGRKFALCEKYYQMANGVQKAQPYYSLTKTECLYIATKFNDEARAKLVLRRETLERQEMERRQQLALPSPKEILRLADDITFNMTVFDFNQMVCDMGIQYRRGGRWNITEELKDRDLVRLRTHSRRG